MAKFIEKLKYFFKNKFVKAILIIAVGILGFILLGKCNKVAAANFTLSDGSTSKVTYNEGQSLHYSSGTGFGATNNYLQISSSFGNYNIVINSVGSATFTIHNICTKSNDTITCTNYNSVGTSSTTATNYTRTYTFTIGYDYVDVYIAISSATNRYTIASATQTDVNNAYDQGYAAGKNSVDITTDNQAYADSYIADNNYHSNSEYLEYGNTKYQEGYNDRDITTDNQTAIDNYIADNNYHTDSDYKTYGQNQYNNGYTAGKNSVDITTDNESYTYEYIINNNYHSNSEYLEYGSSKYNEGYTKGKTDANNTITNSSASYTAGYTAGQNSVDITTDNQAYADSYIKNNNYHSNSEYLEYGETKYTAGYNAGENAGYISGANSNVQDAYNNGYNTGYNQGKIEGINEADNRVNTSSASYINGYASGVASVDITSDNGEVIINYIVKNNYHTDTDYLNYGKAQYSEGYNEGQYIMINGIINNANSKYNTNIDNVCMEDKSKCSDHIESTNKSIYEKGYNDKDITTDNYNAIQTYLNENTLYNKTEYENYGKEQYNLGTQTAEGYEEGYNDGYNSGQRDAEVSILDFFPGIIGAIIGFFITLMQISIFGIKIFDIVGILFGIGLIILILKVMNGGGD